MSCIMQVPRVGRDAAGAFVVAGWGQVAGMTLRAGDRLVLGDAVDVGLLLLEPRGLGRPMFGRWSGRDLLAEPGGVLASQQRWTPVGTVVGIERELSRGVLDDRSWHLAVRLTTTDGVGLGGPPPADLVGGRLGPAGIDAFCLRASVAVEHCGLLVTVAAAATPEAAEDAVDDVPLGAIRYVLPPTTRRSGDGQIIAGPWKGTTVHGQTDSQHLAQRPSESGRMQLRLFGDTA